MATGQCLPTLKVAGSLTVLREMPTLSEYMWVSGEVGGYEGVLRLSEVKLNLEDGQSVHLQL